MPFPTRGRILAIDIGSKRIGLAISDPSQLVGHPLATLTRRTGKRFPLQELRSHLEAYEPVGILVGLPLTPEGHEGDAAQAARAEGTLIREKTAIPVEFQDERMTTARAQSAIRDLGGSTRHRKDDVDALAATVLLQTFLDRRRGETHR